MHCVYLAGVSIIRKVPQVQYAKIIPSGDKGSSPPVASFYNIEIIRE